MLARSPSTILAVASVIVLTACLDSITAPELTPNEPTPGQPSSGLSITAASTYMVPGSMQRLSASKTVNAQTAIRVAATWSSSNPSVLTVDTTGMATATGLGKAVVTATVGNEYASREFFVVQPSTTGTSNALIVDEFSMIEFRHPANTYWEYAPQLRVHTETGRDITILSITFSIPGLGESPAWGCFAPVPSVPSELNGIAYGDWALTISGSGRATSTEVTATITFVDDLVAFGATTVQGRIVAGSFPTIYFDANNGGLCYQQYLPRN